jgi:putative membrane protein
MFTRLLFSILGGAALCAAPSFAQSTAGAKGDAGFLKMAAEADMTTTHIGKMAEELAATNAAKDFGKKLAQDCTSDYNQISELAAKTGDNVPKAIDKQDDREITTLDKRKGKAFDRAFLTEASAEHEKLVKAFQQEAAKGDNRDIKTYANRSLPIIEGHLHEAQDLLKSEVHKMQSEVAKK